MKAASWVWPRVPRSQVSLVHRTAAGHVEPHFLARLVERVPTDGEAEVDAYLAVLDRALLDRHLSATEADELLDVAHELGLHRGDVVAVHVGYLRELARAAWADQVVTAEERRDVEAVAALLGLDAGLARSVIEEEQAARPGSGGVVRLGGLTLRPGDKVVLTGAMTRERDDIVAHATAVGIRVTMTVSKQTTVLVAADPDSLSGKAKKARQLAVPVVSEAAFLAVLDSITAGDDATANQRGTGNARHGLSYDVI
jgi:DNA polymerase-3 subunit epsilon